MRKNGILENSNIKNARPAAALHTERQKYFQCVSFLKVNERRKISLSDSVLKSQTEMCVASAIIF